MTQGERRTAERLEQKLDDDYLVWYDVPVGPKHSHPDFVVLHPRRGLLILEVKDWRLETLCSANRQSWEILVNGAPKTVPNPIEQARHYAHQVVDALSKDRPLTQPDGKLAFPWSYGVVLTRITRRQFETAQLQHAIDPQRVICSDEMAATVDAEEFQSRLWSMFPTLVRGVLSLPQIDRVRWILFPEVRVGSQMVAYGQPLPVRGPDMYEQMVASVIRGVDRQQIPAGQYQAVLIDEGHDFKAEWLKLAAQMVDPATNSLLLLYDDAQSIYQRRRAQQFSFKSVGIPAQGRTTVLKINYRNSRQVLRMASLVAADLLTAQDCDDDGVPLLQPISCGRDGHAPVVVRLPSPRHEAQKIAERLSAAHQEGHAWGDMAVICRHYEEMERCASVLRQRRLPHEQRKGSGAFNPHHDCIKLLTMHASKGLEFPVVALSGVGRMPDDDQDAADEARLFYVAATRATQRLFIPLSGAGRFADRLSASPATCDARGQAA